MNLQQPLTHVESFYRTSDGLCGASVQNSSTVSGQMKLGDCITKANDEPYILKKTRSCTATTCHLLNCPATNFRHLAHDNNEFELDSVNLNELSVSVNCLSISQ